MNIFMMDINNNFMILNNIFLNNLYELSYKYILIWTTTLIIIIIIQGNIDKKKRDIIN